jgi:hypothetical protein
MWRAQALPQSLKAPHLIHTDEFSLTSPRSGREHKAWGVSPRIKEQKWMEPARRAIAVALDVDPDHSAAARSAGLVESSDAILGLTPRLYADVRSADS